MSNTTKRLHSEISWCIEQQFVIPLWETIWFHFILIFSGVCRRSPRFLLIMTNTTLSRSRSTASSGRFSVPRSSLPSVPSSLWWVNSSAVKRSPCTLLALFYFTYSDRLDARLASTCFPLQAPNVGWVITATRQNVPWHHLDVTQTPQ